MVLNLRSVVIIAPRTSKSFGGQWSDEDKMEWQAKTIAPKILMPRHAFRKS